MNHLRYACLAMFYVTTAFFTYRNERLPWADLTIWPAAEVLIYFSGGMSLMVACVIDAKVRRHPLSDGATLVVGITFPISMAIYLIWSRGWRGILWLVLNLFVYILVAFTAAAVANAVTRSQLAAVNARAIQQPLEDQIPPDNAPRGE